MVIGKGEKVGMRSNTFFIVGGAGFIGSHFIDRLLAFSQVQAVTVYDNFSSGREWHYSKHQGDSRLKVIRADVHEHDRLTSSMAGHQTVIHLASNPDIARAITEPDIDFREGTELTRNVVEAVRLTGAGEILYASGSGVYGEIDDIEAHENFGPLIPISTYGASKLAGEALISAYSYMYGFRASVFRFGNVVGRRQTHGVGFDFIRRLRNEPKVLTILGDGRQSKPYVHVNDIIEAVLTAHENQKEKFAAYNVAPGDYITVREIADIACNCLGLDPATVDYQFTGGDRGWKGDVPIVRLNIEKIKKLGWRPTRTSAQALREAMLTMLEDLRGGLE